MNELFQSHSLQLSQIQKAHGPCSGAGVPINPCVSRQLRDSEDKTDTDNQESENRKDGSGGAGRWLPTEDLGSLPHADLLLGRWLPIFPSGQKRCMPL